MSDRDRREDTLEDELRRELVDIVALVDSSGRREWTAQGPLKNDPTEVYDVDPADESGPVVFVRRSDGVRLLVEVDVSVTPERKARLGLTPDGGWEPSSPTVKEDRR